MPRRLPGFGRALRPSSIVGFFNGAIQPHLDQMQHADQRSGAPSTAVARNGEYCRSSPRGRHRRLPGGHGTAAYPPQPPPVGRSPRAVGVLFRWKISFVDRFQHQHRCCHADPISHGRDAQRPEFAVGFRNEHSSDGVRSVSLFPERKRQFAKPPLDAIRLDVREVLTVYSRCALVRATLRVGVCQNVLTADLVVQRVKAVASAFAFACNAICSF